MRRVLTALLAVILTFTAAQCEPVTDGDCIYELYTREGEYLTCRAGRIYEGDEYIGGDDRHYRVSEVDDDACRATADLVNDSESVFSEIKLALEATAAAAKAKGSICMYSTHSDESYEKGDGESSKWENAGIYDVGEAFGRALRDKGYSVTYSRETFLPHDTGAYDRSASTAEELIKKSPEALFDIHRDGVAASEYETEVDGEEMSKVRLFVGRSNANRDVNMAFAKKLKAAADKKYPGLIKDIFIGKGNYNQELYPQALLLEFGTHKIDKALVLESTEYMADVVDVVLGGGSAKAEGAAEEKGGAVSGIVWIIIIAVAAAAIYALLAGSGLSGAKDRLSRGVSELTGGVGRKKK